MDYLIHILILINLYIILSSSLNLILGYNGILSLAHSGFFGIGAYSVAILTTGFGISFVASVFIAFLFAVILCVIIGISSLRLKGDYFIVATFAFQIIILSLMYNLLSVTNGPMGIRGIPAPEIFGFMFSSKISFFLLSTITSISCFLLLLHIVKSPFGRVLKAIRENEILASSLGKNTFLFKVIAFALAGGLAAVAGCLYASYISFIDPSSFSILESIFIISIVIIGGRGNLWGSLIGSIVLVSFPEILRFLGLPNTIAANVRQIFYGMLLVWFMFYRPQGMLKEIVFQSIRVPK